MNYKIIWMKLMKRLETTKKTAWTKTEITSLMKEMELEESRKEVAKDGLFKES